MTLTAFILGFSALGPSKALRAVALASALLLAAWSQAVEPAAEAFRQKLSPSEKAWLDSRKEVKLSPDPNFPPLEFIDGDGSYQGLVADLLRELERIVGLKIEIVRSSTWEEVIEGAKARRFDGITAANKTPSRSAYLLFTRPLVEIPYVAIVRDGGPAELSLDKMGGMKVAITIGYSLQEAIAKNNPEVQIVGVKDPLQALHEVSFGHVDATIENLAVATWLIQRYGITNLHMAGETGPPMKLCIATRSDQPELNSILDKAIAEIPQEVKDSVTRKWIAVDSSVPDRRILMKAAAAIAAILALSGLILAWNLTLHRRIAAKTRELKAELEERRRAEEGIRFTLERAVDGVVIGDAKGDIASVNESALKILGYKKEELLGRNISVLFSEEELKLRPLRYPLMAVGQTILMERSMRRADGSLVEIEMNSKKLDAKTYQAIIREIGDRKRSERELLKYKTLLEVSLQQSPLAVMIAELPSGKVMFANKNTEKFLGIPEKELLDADLENHTELKYRMERLDGSVYKTENLPMLRAMSGETIVNEEAVFIRQDGSRSILSISASPLKDATGRIFAAMVVSSDVTEARRSAEELAKKTKELDTLVENMSQGVILADQDYRIIAFNKKLSEMLKIPEEFLATRPHIDLLIEFCAAKGLVSKEFKSQARANAVRTDNFSKEVEYAGRTFEFRHSPLPDGGFVRTINDLTERKLVEDALRKKTEALNTLVENVSQGIILAGPDLKVAAYNKRLIELLELPESLLEGNPHCSVIIDYVDEMERLPKDSVERARQDILRSDVFVKEFKYCGKTLETSSVPLEGGGFVRTFTDLTERVKAEEERIKMERDLLQTQKLESLGILAGGIAHDFNNLLLAIQGNLELARTNAGLDWNETLRRRLSDAENAAKRAADLTRQMLAYSGQGSFQVKSVQLNSLVSEMLSLLEVSISKNARLELSLAEKLPPVMGDPSQIQQIVMNLIVNASEAMEGKNGSIRVSTALRPFSEKELMESRLDEKPEPGRFLVFEVADDGCGMPPETLARLFEPFFTTKFTGRGLGMSAVMGIMRRHKGAIIVKSEQGVGSVFSILFPEAKESEASQESPKKPAADCARLSGRALVVDDEAMLRDLCVSMLQSFGLSVASASSGDEAIDVCKKDPKSFDCVLMDLTMPGKDGATALAEIREINPDLKVVMSSGYSREEVARKLAGAKIDGYVQKPFKISTLRSEMAKALLGS